MTYKIIGDSCLDLTDELKKDSRFQMIPLTLQVGTATVVDDETFDQKKFIDMLNACPECSGCRGRVCDYPVRTSERQL